MLSSYPERHISLPRLEPSTSEKRWVSVANWATPVGYIFIVFSHVKVYLQNGHNFFYL
ncbi:hypothetical protein Hanom_Chr05g00394781 [Helianthus anomalus]